MKRLIVSAVAAAFLVGFGITYHAVAQTGYSGGGNNFYGTWCKDLQEDHPAAFYALFENLGECIRAGNNDYYYMGYCKSLLENDPARFYDHFDNLGDCLSDPVKFCRFLSGDYEPGRNLGACVTFRKHSPFEP